MTKTVEETFTVASPRGLPYRVAGLLQHRLSGLDCTFLVHPQGREYGFEAPLKGLPYYSWIREWHRAALGHGERVRIEAQGPDSELALAEVRWFMSFTGTDLYEHCTFVESGPRGPWGAFKDTRKLAPLGWNLQAEMEVSVDRAVGTIHATQQWSGK